MLRSRRTTRNLFFAEGGGGGKGGREMGMEGFSEYPVREVEG